MMRRPTVLVHHGVGDATREADPVGLVVPPDKLRSQLRLFTRLGYRFRTAEDLLANSGTLPPPSGTACVTFDDGLASDLRVAAPLLEDLGIRGSFYVCPGLWGRQHASINGDAGRLMTRDEAAELSARGMELGSHAMTHSDLRKLDDVALEAELTESKAAIEDVTGRPCRVIAYPFGLHDERVESASRRAGYELGLGWGVGEWRREAVPRMPGPPRHGALRLGLKLLGIRRAAR
jgi:peptidoglycan/xylan/chitin deacetylase (PgdA/CDA1 family)